MVLLALGCLVIGGARLEAAKTATPSKTSGVSCKTCHAAGLASLVPKGHPPVKGNDLASCTACHKPDLAGTVKKNTFSSRMHLAHLPPKGKVDCLVCHRWTPGKSFGLVGMKESWGAPTKEEMGLVKEIFASWAGSNFTDHLHARAGVGCITCHGKDEAFPRRMQRWRTNVPGLPRAYGQTGIENRAEGFQGSQSSQVPPGGYRLHRLPQGPCGLDGVLPGVSSDLQDDHPWGGRGKIEEVRC